MLRSTRLHMLLFLLLLVITACSNESSGEQTKEKEDPEEKHEQEFDYPEAARDAERIIEQGPGGIVQKIEVLENIEDDEKLYEELKAEVKTLPDDLSADQLYDFLIAKFAFPYQVPADAYDEFDPIYKLPSERQEEEKQKNIVFLLDSSGSMAGQVNGGVKMDLAKSALNRVLGNLDPKTKIALRVYGHKGSSDDKDKKVSCDSSETVYALNSYDEGTFQDALKEFKPSGWTPIAASLQLAQDDFKGATGNDVENVIYVISDGVETCDGDPVAAAKEIHDSDLNVTVNVIGFNVDSKGQNQLKDTAAAGGGKYKDVNSKADLNNTLNELISDAKKGIDKDISDAKAGIDINTWYMDQNSRLRKIHDTFIDISRTESEVLENIVFKLDDEGKLKGGIYTGLTDLIDERMEVMEEYSRERKDSLMEETEASHKKAREELEKKSQE